MGIPHDLSLLDLFIVSVTSFHTDKTILTRPIAAKWFSRSLLSTRWLRPETWRLLPGFWPPGEPPRLNLWYKRARMWRQAIHLPAPFLLSSNRAPAAARASWSITTTITIPARIFGAATVGDGGVRRDTNTTFTVSWGNVGLPG
jgi:hypothetical protein